MNNNKKIKIPVFIIIILACAACCAGAYYYAQHEFETAYDQICKQIDQKIFKGKERIIQTNYAEIGGDINAAGQTIDGKDFLPKNEYNNDVKQVYSKPHFEFTIFKKLDDGEYEEKYVSLKWIGIKNDSEAQYFAPLYRFSSSYYNAPEAFLAQRDLYIKDILSFFKACYDKLVTAYDITEESADDAKINNDASSWIYKFRPNEYCNYKEDTTLDYAHIDAAYKSAYPKTWRDAVYFGGSSHIISNDSYKSWFTEATRTYYIAKDKKYFNKQILKYAGISSGICVFLILLIYLRKRITIV